VSISPDGKSLYVVGVTNGTTVNSYYVEVIDTQTNTATTRIGLGNNGRIAVTPDGNHAYVTDDGGDLWVIDTTKNAVLASVAISKGNPLLGVSITPDGTRVYVTCGNNSTIYVLDTATNRVVQTVRSDSPGGLAIGRVI
jgi:YVTN family beta-propeller protein